MSSPHNSCIWHGLGSPNTVHVFPGVIFHIKKQEHSQVQTSKALNATYSVQWELQRMEASKKASAAAADCSKYMKGQYQEDSLYFLFLSRGSSNWSKFHLHWSDGLDCKRLIFFQADCMNWFWSLVLKALSWHYKRRGCTGIPGNEAWLPLKSCWGRCCQQGGTNRFAAI